MCNFYVPIITFSEGWFRYAVNEMSQRYHENGPLANDIDISLRFRLERLHPKFSSRCINKLKVCFRLSDIRWGTHHCNAPGCREVIIFDGGMKAQVKILF